MASHLRQYGLNLLKLHKSSSDLMVVKVWPPILGNSASHWELRQESPLATILLPSRARARSGLLSISIIITIAQRVRAALFLYRRRTKRVFPALVTCCLNSFERCYSGPVASTNVFDRAAIQASVTSDMRQTALPPYSV